MKLLPFVAIVAAVSQLAHGGLVIQQEVEQSAGPMPGKMPLTIKVSGDKTRVDVGTEVSSIVDAKSGTVTSLLHSQKMAMKLPEGTLDSVRKKTAENKTAPDIKPTGKKETINGFECEEYAGTIEGMKVNLWVTRDVKNASQIIDQLGKISGGADPLMKALQSAGGVQGFPIRTVVDIPQTGKSTSTILSIKDEDVPESTFVVPDGYKSMDAPKMAPPGGGAPAVPSGN